MGGILAVSDPQLFGKRLVGLARAGERLPPDVIKRLSEVDDFASAPSAVLSLVTRAAVNAAAKTGNFVCLRKLAQRISKTAPPSADGFYDSEDFYLWVVGPVFAAQTIAKGGKPFTIPSGGGAAK